VRSTRPADKNWRRDHRDAVAGHDRHEWTALRKSRVLMKFQDCKICSVAALCSLDFEAPISPIANLLKSSRMSILNKISRLHNTANFAALAFDSIVRDNFAPSRSRNPAPIFVTHRVHVHVMPDVKTANFAALNSLILAVYSNTPSCRDLRASCPALRSR